MFEVIDLTHRGSILFPKQHSLPESLCDQNPHVGVVTPKEMALGDAAFGGDVCGHENLELDEW